MGTDWIKYAACAGYDPEKWFKDNWNNRDSRIARKVCDACPVRQECLSFALSNGERFGIWGGVSASGRQPPVQRPRRPRADRAEWLKPCGTEAAARRHQRHNDPPCAVCGTGSARRADRPAAPAGGALAVVGGAELAAAS